MEFSKEKAIERANLRVQHLIKQLEEKNEQLKSIEQEQALKLKIIEDEISLKVTEQEKDKDRYEEIMSELKEVEKNIQELDTKIISMDEQIQNQIVNEDYINQLFTLEKQLDIIKKENIKLITKYKEEIEFFFSATN